MECALIFELALLASFTSLDISFVYKEVNYLKKS